MIELFGLLRYNGLIIWATPTNWVLTTDDNWKGAGQEIPVLSRPVLFYFY